MSLEQAVNQYDFETLEEYTIDSTIGCDLAKLYESILLEITGKSYPIVVDEVSDGKYIIAVDPEGKNITLMSYANDTKERVTDNMKFLSRYFD